MKRFRETVESTYKPDDKNVLWLDVSDADNPILRFWYIDGWAAIAGGGSGPTPTPTALSNFYYYGASDTRYTVSTIDITRLSAKKISSTTGTFNKVYYYIATSSDQNIVSVITANNENITNQFSSIGTFDIEGEEYTLHEFFLDTLIPLDITATIKINGNTR